MAVRLGVCAGVAVDVHADAERRVLVRRLNLRGRGRKALDAQEMRRRAQRDTEALQLLGGHRGVQVHAVRDKIRGILFRKRREGERGDSRAGAKTFFRSCWICTFASSSVAPE